MVKVLRGFFFHSISSIRYVLLLYLRGVERKEGGRGKGRKGGRRGEGKGEGGREERGRKEEGRKE